MHTYYIHVMVGYIWHCKCYLPHSVVCQNQASSDFLHNLNMRPCEGLSKSCWVRLFQRLSVLDYFNIVSLTLTFYNFL